MGLTNGVNGIRSQTHEFKYVIARDPNQRIFWLNLFFVGLLAFVCYLNAINAGFVYDDSRAILSNLDLRPETPWLSLFRDDFWGTPLLHSGSHKSYRPLCVLSFRLNYHLSELNPTGYHLINIIIHCIVTCLFYYWSNLMTRDLWTSTVSSLVFATHPVHTEAVAGIVGRADVASTMFFLISLLFYIKSCEESVSLRSKAVSLSIVVLFAALSMFTKENGVTVLGVCVLYDLIIVTRFNPKDIQQSIKKMISSGCLGRIIFIISSATLLLYWRLLIMGHTVPHFASADNPAAHDESIVTRTLTFLYLPVFNFMLLLCPSTLSFDWSMHTVSLVERISDERVIAIVIFYVVLATTIIKCINTIPLIKAKRKKQDFNQNNVEIDKDRNLNVQHNSIHELSIVLFSISSMSVIYLPASNLLFYVGFVVAERLLYLPSMFYCLLVGMGAKSISTKFINHSLTMRKMFHLFLVCLVLLFSLRTYLRNFDWKDEESLYRSGIPISPAKALGNLANVLGAKGELKEAETAYKSALDYRPNMADAHYNLGILLQNQNRLEEAIESYQKAIKYRPKLAAAHLNLGITLYDYGKKSEAIEVLHNAKDISDVGLKDPRAHATSLTSVGYNLGKFYFEMGKHKKSIESLEDAIRKMPKAYEAHSIYNMKGQAHSFLGQHELAEKCYVESLKHKKDHIPAQIAYAKHLAKTGRNEDAEKWFTKAKELDPNNTDTIIHFGLHLKSTNRIAEASTYLEHALELQPSAGLYIQAAEIRRLMNDLDKAEMFYKKAVDLQPQDASHYLNYGAILHLQQKYKMAAKAYNRSLALNPDDELTKSNLKKVNLLIRRMEIKGLKI